jgi:hypothetical protein
LVWWLTFRGNATGVTAVIAILVLVVLIIFAGALALRSRRKGGVIAASPSSTPSDTNGEEQP